MKFAKYLEDNLVPEWRVKYLNYKGGKKKLKNVARALRHAEAAASAPLITRHSPHFTKRTPANSVRTDGTPGTWPINYAPSTGYTPQLAVEGPTPGSEQPPPSTARSGNTPQFGRTMSMREGAKSPRMAEPRSPRSPEFRRTPHFAPTVEEEHEERGQAEERTPLQQPMQHGVRAYGSIGEGPTDALGPQITKPPSLQLPDPIKPLDERTSMSAMRANTFDSSELSHGGDPTVGVLHIPRPGTQPTPTWADDVPIQGINNAPTIASTVKRRPYLHRLFKNVALKLHLGRANSDPTIRRTAEYLIMTEDAQREFFEFLDEELEKISNFYNLKEQEARERLAVLEQQIEIMMANRTWQKEEEAKEKAQQAANGKKGFSWPNGAGFHVPAIMGGKSKDVDDDTKPTIAKLGATAAGLAAAPTSTRESMHGIDPARRDYNRRPQYQQPQVGYRSAKRKIKLAILEYYRGLELLKSYCLLNREGFRKILKKFDKTAHKRLSAKYMNEKVHTASFATSDELDTLMGKVEELFATYWERGRRKHAVERLRTKDQKAPQTGAMFRVGVYLGSGIPFLVQSLYLAFNDRQEDDYGMWHESEVSYLLQVWAGFGLPILFMMLFSLCCRAWSLAKINYVFIFEFDKKHNIDWRQLLEIPALLAAIMCFLMFFTFSGFWGDDVDRIWFPLVFLGVVFVVMFNPIRIFYYESRRWFLYALWRLLWAGFYPVEFRDFWLSDMFCSLTYTMTTVPLLVCLYSRNWDDPVKCNSSHSRVLGFFSTLPGLWRLFQCFRRYYDTQNVFPHLVNGGKYSCTILFYLSLSLWRMDKENEKLRSLFIFCAVINSVYTTVWDLAMDWSLLDWDAPNKFLRSELGFKRPSVYYAAMCVDPLIRFNWVFYIIFQSHVQHSAIVSFLTSLSELFRRWIWCFFRLENEHCTNVGRFRAYRDDIPLPYNVPCPGVSENARHGSMAMNSLTSVLEENGVAAKSKARTDAPQTDGSAYSESPRLERAETYRTVASLRSNASDRRPYARGRANSTTPIIRALSIVATNAAQAHAADFERKRPTTVRSGLHRVQSGIKGKVDEDVEDDEISSEEEDSAMKHPASGTTGLTTATALSTAGGVGLPTDQAAMGIAERMTGLRRRGTGMMELSTAQTGTDVLQVSDFGGTPPSEGLVGNGEGGSNWAARFGRAHDTDAQAGTSEPLSPRSVSPSKAKFPGRD